MSRDQWKELAIDQMVKASWNYKSDDVAKMEKLKANLKRNGLVQNLIVRMLPTGFYEVVNGNHRLEALQDIGVESAMVFDLGDVTDAAAMRVAVETNELNFETDNIKLADRLYEITQAFGVAEVAATGAHTEAEISNYLRLREFDFTQYDKGSKDGQSGGASPSSGSSSDDADWVTLEYRLPESVAEAFEAQVARVKLLLYPDKKAAEVSDVTAIEAVGEMLRQLGDERLKAEITG